MKKLIVLVALLTGCAHTQFFSSESWRAYEAFEEAKKITYKADEDDHWQTPAETRILGHGDCEDQAFYLQRLLLDQGIKSIVMFGATEKNNEELHVWNEVIINKREYILDVTNNIFEKRTILSDKYPGCYESVVLTLVEKRWFETNVDKFKDRLGNFSEKTDLVKYIRN